MLGRIFWGLMGGLIAGLVAALGTPVLWLLIRVGGLTQPLAGLLGGLDQLMWIGGPVLGALVGGLFLVMILRAWGEVTKWMLACGLAGGAVGGLVSSWLLFAIVMFL